ncbi:MAG TPA: hypothetical protein VI146_07125 [Nitrososphaeraceae archaeon]
METQSVVLTPYKNFLFAFKAKETKRQYPHRLDKFMNFMGLQGNIQEKCLKLYQYANGNVNLLQSNIIRFINFQRERIAYKEPSEGTLHNYIKVLIPTFENLLYFISSPRIIYYNKPISIRLSTQYICSIPRNSNCFTNFGKRNT